MQGGGSGLTFPKGMPRVKGLSRLPLPQLASEDPGPGEVPVQLHP